MTDLKPCPFCGGNAKLMTYHYQTLGDMLYVTCLSCGNETTGKLTAGEAIAAWNRRVDNRKERDND